MVYYAIDDRKFEWIRDVDEILSKAQLEIREEGGRVVSDYDVILSHLSSNLSLLYALAEAKKILNVYRKVMERVATAVKRLYNEMQKLKDANLIKINNEYYYIQQDKTIFREQDLHLLEEAYYNLQESFRQLGRAFIYILISAIEPVQKTEDDKPQQPQYQYQPQPINYYQQPQMINQGGVNQ